MPRTTSTPPSADPAVVQRHRAAFRVFLPLSGFCRTAPTALQFDIRSADGALLGRSDFAWEPERLVGEFDGRVKYGRLLRPGQDAGDVVFEEKRREDAIRDEHWNVVRWIWADLHRPDRLAARVRRARERAGAVG